jgi:hypothetical protein
MRGSTFDVARLDLDRDRAKRQPIERESQYPDAADRWLARVKTPPMSRVEFGGGRKPYRQRKHAAAAEVCIVIGAASDSNTTGEREVLFFPNLTAAHKAGFSWAV